MNVSIDRDACIGCGVCAGICAYTFEMGDDQKARVIREPDADNEGCAATAAGDCPTNAILLG